MGSLDEALLEYDQAIVVRKESYLGHYFKGLCLYQMQQFNESMVCLDRCLKINPYAPAYVLKGNILKLLFQLNESKYLFRDCLERYPEDILCLSNYGSLLYLMLERDKAFNLL
jgi:tetratricopeptide (TPR) repeat protein